jgi:hypothetical protein
LHDSGGRHHKFRDLGTSVFLGAKLLDFTKSEKRLTTSGKKKKDLQCPAPKCGKRLRARTDFLVHLYKHPEFKFLGEKTWDKMMSEGEFYLPAPSPHLLAPTTALSATGHTLQHIEQTDSKRARRK